VKVRADIERKRQGGRMKKREKRVRVRGLLRGEGVEVK
jgi:hypothetical protein